MTEPIRRIKFSRLEVIVAAGHGETGCSQESALRRGSFTRSVSSPTFSTGG
jgi:hypothetical protein